MTTIIDHLQNLINDLKNHLERTEIAMIENLRIILVKARRPPMLSKINNTGAVLLLFLINNMS